ncbi:hypothetical protein [Paenibacillus sp. BIC5C1]|uniref:hypothetical protein n=1 Tax=Paenibacillus sp. BIC5C1 TaxID=3078263 RepID=UPI0028F0BFD1|nr:hypothetical protein [Paenibacillus sp. BIC5C1]
MSQVCHYEIELDVINNLPYLIVRCSNLLTYNDLKNKLLLQNSLLRKESNLDHYFIDVEEDIEFRINLKMRTIRVKSKKNKFILLQSEIIEDDETIADYSKELAKTQNLYIHVYYIEETIYEEFVVMVKDITINQKKVNNVDIQEGKMLFNRLPNSREFFSEGIIYPSGVGLGTYEKEKGNEISIIVLEYPNNEIHRIFKENLDENLIVNNGYAENLSVLVDEVQNNLVIIKLQLTETKVAIESTTSIKVTENYERFKSNYLLTGYADIHFMIGKEGVSSESYVKTDNVIILNDQRKKELLAWIDPIELDLGGMDSNKKVLINPATLEMGIYKYFMNYELDKNNIRKFVNELLSYNIGKELDLPVVETIFHMDKDTTGIISKVITPPVYKFDEIPFEKIEDKKKLISMVAFDIFICNTDRHSGNICLQKDGDYYLPRLIDHSRSFGGYYEDSFTRLSNNTFSYPLNLLGLNDINNLITDLSVFTSFILKLEELDVQRIVTSTFVGELNTLIYSQKTYQDKNYIQSIINLLSWRKENILTILKKSLGFE